MDKMRIEITAIAGPRRGTPALVPRCRGRPRNVFVLHLYSCREQRFAPPVVSDVPSVLVVFWCSPALLARKAALVKQLEYLLHTGGERRHASPAPGLPNSGSSSLVHAQPASPVDADVLGGGDSRTRAIEGPLFRLAEGPTE